MFNSSESSTVYLETDYSISSLKYWSYISCRYKKGEKQLIFVMRECVSSYTSAHIVEDEKTSTLMNVIIQSCIELRPLGGPFAVRTDPASGFEALANTDLLQSQRIPLELGRIKI